MSWEAALRDSYGNGVYHFILTILSSFTLINTAFEYHAVVFMQYEPEFKCSDGKLATSKWITEDDYLGLLAWKTKPPNISSLRSSHKQCWAVTGNGSRNFAFECSSWNYSEEVMRRTLVTDLDLVCGRQTFSHWLSSSLLIGAALGHTLAIFTGDVNRRRIFVFYVFWEVLLKVVGIFGNSFPYFLTTRLLYMLALPIIYVSQTIIQETLPTSRRALYGNVFWGLAPLGPLAAAGIAYGIRDWFTLRLYGLLLFIPYIPLLCLMPDSPRELILKRKWARFKHLVRLISCWNKGKAISPENWAENPSSEITQRPDTWLDIFRRPNTRTKALTLMVNSTASYITYYGLSMNPTVASADVFLNMIYLALAEIPAGLIGWILSSKMGRRPTFIVIYIISAPCLILPAVVQSRLPILATTLVLISRLAISVTSNVSTLSITENYPTSVRNQGLSISLAVSCAVSGLVPFINALGTTVSACIPGAVYAIFCLVAGLLVMAFLPETKNCPLAQTLEESEKLVTGKEAQWIEMMETQHI